MNIDYSQFYRGTTYIPTYGNGAYKKDTLVKYEFNTTDEHGNKIMDKMSKEEEGLAKIGKGANLYGAPLAISVCADHGRAWVRLFDKKQTADIDASILTDHVMLQATELGLGSVWICYFKPDVISREFGLPDNLDLVRNCTLPGYQEKMTY